MFSINLAPFSQGPGCHVLSKPVIHVLVKYSSADYLNKVSTFMSKLSKWKTSICTFLQTFVKLWPFLHFFCAINKMWYQEECSSLRTTLETTTKPKSTYIHIHAHLKVMRLYKHEDVSKTTQTNKTKLCNHWYHVLEVNYLYHKIGQSVPC